MKLEAIAIAAAVCCLAGCKADYTGEGSIQAALAAAEGKAASMTGVIAIEAGSESTCRRDANELTEALAKEYPGAAFLGCAAHGLDTMAEFRVMLPVLRLKAGEDSHLPLAIVAEVTDKLVMISLYLEGSSVNRVMDGIPDDKTSLFPGQFEATVTIDVRNDTAAEISIGTHGAFVDGKPIPFWEKHNLTPGQTLRVQPSNVHLAALGAGGSAFLFTVPLPQ